MVRVVAQLAWSEGFHGSWLAALFLASHVNGMTLRILGVGSTCPEQLRWCPLDLIRPVLLAEELLQPLLLLLAVAGSLLR